MHKGREGPNEWCKWWCGYVILSKTLVTGHQWWIQDFMKGGRFGGADTPKGGREWEGSQVEVLEENEYACMKNTPFADICICRSLVG